MSSHAIMLKRVQAQFSRRSGSPAPRQIRTSGDRHRPQIETEQKSYGVILNGMIGSDLIRHANRALGRDRPGFPGASHPSTERQVTPLGCVPFPAAASLSVCNSLGARRASPRQEAGEPGHFFLKRVKWGSLKRRDVRARYNLQEAAAVFSRLLFLLGFLSSKANVEWEGNEACLSLNKATQ